MCLCLVAAYLPTEHLKAASADISFYAEEPEVEAGREFTLILEISADMTIGDFEGYFTYDADIAEYTYGPACITGGDGYLKISDINAAPTVGLRSYVMTFTAKKRGVCQFRMSGVPVVYAYESGNSMSVMSEPYQLTIRAAANASNNARAAALRVSPGALVPGFSPEITEYEVELDASVERIIVSAVSADSKALVSVSGNESLSEGENDVNVTITAEDGTECIYHILVRRGSSSGVPTMPTPVPEDKDNPGSAAGQEERTLYLSEDGTMLCGNYRYRLTQEISGIMIPDGYEADYLLIGGESITAYMTSRQAEYCLLVLENEAGETGLYRFDRKEYTIQRYEPEIVTVTDTSSLNQKVNELLSKTQEYEQKKNNMSILCGLLGVVIVVLLLLCVRLRIRRGGSEL